MTLLPDFPHAKKMERYEARLVESAWVILDMARGERHGKARYTVEVQARWTAEMLNAAFREGIEVGKRRAAQLAERSC